MGAIHWGGVAGRNLPLWIATLTMTATWVDGGYLLGTTQGAYSESLAHGIQGGMFFGISLLLGGLFFARKMRALEYATLIDPFEARYGKRWAAVLFPSVAPPNQGWTTPKAVGWWDTSIMLMLGGIPWNCYFQRVLACQTPAKARWHSLLAGVLTIAVTVPPLLLGMAASAHFGSA